MTWFRVDDKAHSDPKLVAAGNGAVGLWTMAGSWCSDQLTDGFVPEHMLPRLGGTKREADKLVAVGLWEPSSRGGASGWQFHDWADQNPTRAQVEAERAKWRERQAKARGKSPLGQVTNIAESRKR